MDLVRNNIFPSGKNRKLLEELYEKLWDPLDAVNLAEGPRFENVEDEQNCLAIYQTQILCVESFNGTRQPSNSDEQVDENQR